MIVACFSFPPFFCANIGFLIFNSKYYAILWSQTPSISLLFYYLLEIICEKFKEICGFFLKQETNDFLTLKKQGAT